MPPAADAPDDRGLAHRRTDSHRFQNDCGLARSRDETPGAAT